MEKELLRSRVPGAQAALVTPPTEGVICREVAEGTVAGPAPLPTRVKEEKATLGWGQASPRKRRRKVHCSRENTVRDMGKSYFRAMAVCMGDSSCALCLF